MRTKTALKLIVIPALLLLVFGGCGGGGSSQPSGNKSNGGASKQQAASGAKTKPGETVAGASGSGNATTISGNTEARARATTGQGSTAAGTGRSRNVRVQVSGAQGLKFGGTCAVGGGQYEVGGQGSKSFTYTVGDGQKLTCRIRKRGNGVGPMKVVVTAKGNNHVLQTDSRWAMLNFTYSGRGFASSINSSVANSSSSSSQTQNSSSSSSTNSP